MPQKHGVPSDEPYEQTGYNEPVLYIVKASKVTYKLVSHNKT